MNLLHGTIPVNLKMILQRKEFKLAATLNACESEKKSGSFHIPHWLLDRYCLIQDVSPAARAIFLRLLRYSLGFHQSTTKMRLAASTLSKEVGLNKSQAVRGLNELIKAGYIYVVSPSTSRVGAIFYLPWAEEALAESGAKTHLKSTTAASSGAGSHPQRCKLAPPAVQDRTSSGAISHHNKESPKENFKESSKRAGADSKKSWRTGGRDWAAVASRKSDPNGTIMALMDQVKALQTQEDAPQSMRPGLEGEGAGATNKAPKKPFKRVM